MDYVLSKIKRYKEEKLFRILSDVTLFSSVPDYSHSRSYNDEYKLQDEEWFVLENFSEKNYCPTLLINQFTAANYAALPTEKYSSIQYIVSVQNEATLFLFQKVTQSAIYERKRWLSFSHQASLIEENNMVVIKEIPDAIYNKNEDKMYFKQLNSITSVFVGIDELYREATTEEVQNFLGLNILNINQNFTIDKVKTANRKRIKAAQETYSNFTDDQKALIPEYAVKYCNDIYDIENKRFNISSDEELTKALNILNQRYYTTEIGEEKRLANSVEKVE